MQGRVVILVLPVEHLLEQILELRPEILAYGVIFIGVHEMLELGEYPVILPRIKLPLLLRLEQLQVEEQLEELVVTLRVYLQVDLKQSLYALETLSVFALRRVVNRVAKVWLVLLGEDLSHLHEQVSRVLLEEGLHANVELFVPLHGVCIVENRRNQVAMLYIHVFKPITLLFSIELIKQGLLQVDALDVQNLDEALIVSLVGKQVEHRATLVAHVDLITCDLGGCAQVSHQVQHDIFETQITVQINHISNLTKRGPRACVPSRPFE